VSSAKSRDNGGVYQTIGVLPALLEDLGNRMWFSIHVHKVAVTAPFACWAFAASFALPIPWRTPIVMAEMLFLRGRRMQWSPEEGSIKKVTLWCENIVVMMFRGQHYAQPRSGCAQYRILEAAKGDTGSKPECPLASIS